MEALLFIDTNILLDFYRVRHEAGLGLLKHIDDHQDRIITTAQVEMEFKNNRQRAILESYGLLKTPEWGGLQPPAFLSQAKPTRALERYRKGIAAKVKTLRGRMGAVLRSPTGKDPVYKVVQRLFRSGTAYNLPRDHENYSEICEAARRRYELGYPPQKAGDSGCGDAINWEWIIRCAKSSGKNVVIVTRDSDYGCTFDRTPVLNDWLLQEFRERVTRKRKVTLTDRLSEGFKALSIPITTQEEAEEEELVALARDATTASEPRGYVESVIACQCGALLGVHWEAILGVITGNHFIACPTCHRRHRVPAQPLRLFAGRDGVWVPAPLVVPPEPHEFEPLRSPEPPRE